MASQTKAGTGIERRELCYCTAHRSEISRDEEFGRNRHRPRNGPIYPKWNTSDIELSRRTQAKIKAGVKVLKRISRASSSSQNRGTGIEQRELCYCTAHRSEISRDEEFGRNRRSTCRWNRSLRGRDRSPPTPQCWRPECSLYHRYAEPQRAAPCARLA